MTPSTRGSVTSAAADLVVGARQELEDLARDAGVPQRSVASSQPTSTASGAGLRMTALPAASAASTPPAGMDSGKFQGGVTTTTPSGSMRQSSTSSRRRRRARA